MAAQQNFRSALNGFNREDVVRYIEYLNAKHAAEVNQLKTELDFLRSKADQPASEPEFLLPEIDEMNPVAEEQAEQIQELLARCAAQEQKIAELKAEKEQLTAQLAQAQSCCAAQTGADQEISGLKAENEQLAAQLAEIQRRCAMQTTAELEAYRRAERTERLARERAERVYQQANGVLADATVKVDEAADQIGALSEQVMGQLAELQSAVSGSKQALRDAAATMYSLRPAEDSE